MRTQHVQVASQLWDTKYLCTEAQQGFGMDSSDHGERDGVLPGLEMSARSLWRYIVDECDRRWFVPRLLQSMVQ